MRFVIPAAAVATLLSTATVTFAQGQPDRLEKGGQERSERAAPRRDAGGNQNRGEMRSRAEPRGRTQQGNQRGAAERRLDRSPDRAQSEDRRVRQQSERRERTDLSRERSSRNAEQRQIERKQGERRQVQRPEGVERRVDRKSDPARVQERRDGQAGQRADRDGRVQERREAVREARTRLTAEQRARFYSSFDRRRVTNVRFSARVGTRIPRSVRLYAIPATVVGFVPAYSYYRYVYLDDTICIVDPATYEVVDVIKYGSGGPAVLEARLDLTPAERALILDSIAADYPETEIDLRLALGAEVPGRVELHTFPDVVLDRIPKLRDYRFVVSEGNVVIVSGRDRGIELVVRR